MKKKERIQLLLAEMNKGVYEKETEIGLALLAALAGESILLLGPPGVAKSMIARNLKNAFAHAKAFEYLMSRFSTPDEIFGPVSICRLKESDTYERVIEGYLPTSDVVFLDEIWKAGPAIQNTLLTVINEKHFRNGDKELILPLKLLVAASNELPAQGEGLEALWDRFLIRLVCSCVKKEKEFYKMLLDEGEYEADGMERQWQITNEEYEEWQKKIKTIPVSEETLTCITNIRKELGHVMITDTEMHRKVYVSDRRWKKIVRLLKACAFIHDREEVCPVDMILTYHCLWNEPDECDDVRQIVIRSLFTGLNQKLKSIEKSLSADLRLSRVKGALEEAKRKNDHRDDDLVIVDNFYYQLEDHGTGNTYIFMVDYRNMKEYSPGNAAHQGSIYPDPFNPKRTLIRAFYGEGLEEEKDVTSCTLYRDDKHIYINGVRFPMRRLKRGEKQKSLPNSNDLPITSRDYEDELYKLNNEIGELADNLADNIFISEEDKKCINDYVSIIRKKIAYARVDVRKLMYGDPS